MRRLPTWAVVALAATAVAVLAVGAAVWAHGDDPEAAAPSTNRSSTTAASTSPTDVQPSQDQPGNDQPRNDQPSNDQPSNAADAPQLVPPTGPAPTATGPLSSADVPAPSVIGDDFTTFVDPGGAESGWIGNGTFVRGRDAHEAAFGVLPLGCKNRLDVDLPIPAFALQGSYHDPKARPAQVVVLDFGTNGDASSYFDGFTAMLAACTRPDGPSGVAVRVTQRDGTSLVGRRDYGQGEVWSEVDVLTGSRVAVLLSSVPIADGAAVVPTLRDTVAAR